MPCLKVYCMPLLLQFLWGVLAIVLKVSLYGSHPGRYYLVQVFPGLCQCWQSIIITESPITCSILKRPPWLLIVATLCLAVKLLMVLFKGLTLTSPSIAQVFIQLGPVIAGGFRIYLFP